MFDSLPVLPPDSILGLAAACRADPNPNKVDLTLGVYMDETGLCPVFESVRQAQKALVSEEQTKVYMPPQGDPDYLNGVRSLVFGEAGLAALGDRTSAVQTPGGVGRSAWVRKCFMPLHRRRRSGSAIRPGPCISH